MSSRVSIAMSLVENPLLNKSNSLLTAVRQTGFIFSNRVSVVDYFGVLLWSLQFTLHRARKRTFLKLFLSFLETARSSKIRDSGAEIEGQWPRTPPISIPEETQGQEENTRPGEGSYPGF